MEPVQDLLLSCWIIEAARSAVLSGRGHSEASVRAAERARLIAGACSNRGIQIVPRFASEHAEWMAEVSGSQEETGPWGWFFLQRLGMYVDAHLRDTVDPAQHERLVELSKQDVEDVAAALTDVTVPAAPPAEFPVAEPARLQGPALGRFGILGDPHVGTKASAALIPAALERMAELDFIVAIGDVTQAGKLEQFEKAREVFSGYRVLPTLGNHDMWAGGPERFNTFFEREPYFEQTANGYRVVVLSSANPAASPFPPFDLFTGMFTDEPNESVPGGLFSTDMREWIGGLNPGLPTFILLHHPPFPYLGLPPLVFGLDSESTQVLGDLAEHVGALAIFCGHTHRSALSELRGIPVIEVPSSKEWPFAYGIVEISEEEWTFNLLPIDDHELIEKWSADAGIMFRRYARGPEEARAFRGRIASSG